MSLVNDSDAVRATKRAAEIAGAGFIGVGYTRFEIVRCCRDRALCSVCRNPIPKARFCLERRTKNGRVLVRLCSEDCWRDHDWRVWDGVARTRIAKGKSKND